MLEWLRTKSWKTYLSAAGLLGLAVYQFSVEKYQEAWETFMAALAVLGLRHAIYKAAFSAAGETKP